MQLCPSTRPWRCTLNQRTLSASTTRQYPRYIFTTDDSVGHLTNQRLLIARPRHSRRNDRPWRLDCIRRILRRLRTRKPDWCRINHHLPFKKGERETHVTERNLEINANLQKKTGKPTCIFLSTIHIYRSINWASTTFTLPPPSTWPLSMKTSPWNLTYCFCFWSKGRTAINRGWEKAEKVERKVLRKKQPRGNQTINSSSVYVVNRNFPFFSFHFMFIFLVEIKEIWIMINHSSP